MIHYDQIHINLERESTKALRHICTQMGISLEDFVKMATITYLQNVMGKDRNAVVPVVE